MELNELNKRANGGTENVHRALDAKINPELLDKFQLIPSRVRKLDNRKKWVLVLHDLPSDPESAHLREKANQNKFASIVCVSHWQKDMYNLQLGIPLEKITVIQNAIEPFPYRSTVKATPDDGKIRLIYHTTPHRGLRILVPVFEKLAERYPEIELDVYSSFSIYGWEERDAPYKELFDRCRAHPQINYHGAVPNAQVREALQRADIFSYPSEWPETSCIAAIEALAAGCMMVASSYAALPETCANFALMYPFAETAQVHANRFATNLITAIETVKAYRGTPSFEGRRNFQAQYFNMNYSWDYRIPQWEQHLRSLL